MKYPVLLFDLDSTLLDTEKNAENALRKMKIAKTFPFNREQLNYWHSYNNHLWRQFEDNEITRDQLFAQRFKNYFLHYGITIDPDAFQDEYIKLFADEHALIPHAKELLSELTDHRLFVISNGTKQKQYSQMSYSKIDTYFDKVILAEDLGYKKPDPMFFKKAEAEVPDANKSDMLVIGDSLTADIAGANAVDLDSVWFNPKHSKNKTDIKPTFEVDDLLSIKNILK